MELAEIIDVQAIQYLMDDFFKLVHMPIGLNDLKGKVLVGAGWQDICTKFHWVHPEACKHCVGSDAKLFPSVLHGETKLYKCKNNMWDITAPITVGSQHVGYIFLGQFFFEDEPLDYELFRSQARKYGFIEEEYVTAFEKVPRLSREAVETGMSFFLKFANLLSQLSYSNIKLAQSLAKRDALVEALRESEKSERVRSKEMAVVLDAVPAAVWITHDPKALKMNGNRLSYEWLRLPEGSNISKAAPEGDKLETYKLFMNGVEIPPADMPVRLSASGKELHDYEFDLVYPDGTMRHLLGNARPLRDEQGNSCGSVSAFIDITGRKKTEEALKKANDSLEEKVKERTAELEIAFNSLKESEKSLAEAQKMAHIGNWDWNILTNKLYYSDELYRIFGLNPEELDISFDEVINYIHPDDRDYVNNAFKEALNGKRYGEVDFRVVLADGTKRVVHTQGGVIFDENNNPVRIKGTVQDITERKKAEEKIRNLAHIVESSNDAIGTISPEGIITSWNKGAEQVYGYSHEDVLGKPTSFLAPSHLGDETKKLTERVKKGESIHQYETSRLRKDGKIIDVSITLSPVFDNSGMLTAFSFISRDISERKTIEEKLRESEEKYRNIVETASEGILIIDNEAIITYGNKKLADMFGYTLAESVGRPIWDFLSEGSKAIVKLNLKNRWLGIDDSYELKLIKKDGSVLWAIVNAKPLFDRDGEFVGSISMLTDITKRKEVEQALANFEIAREKEIHHRIKNNLQIVSSLLDLQAYKFKGRNDINDSEVIDALKESQSRVISMALIHEELYKGGGLETINFSEYIEKLADNIFSTYKLGNTNISLNKDLEEDLFLDMDTVIPLGTIINELVSNSFKYAFPGRDKGEIRIKLQREENGDFINIKEESKCEGPKNTNLILSVSDNGIGIPKSLDIENLDSLGLHLVTSLVEQLDGKLEIKRNNGTEFAIKFTVTEKNNKESAPVPKNQSESPKFNH